MVLVVEAIESLLHRWHRCSLDRIRILWFFPSKKQSFRNGRRRCCCVCCCCWMMMMTTTTLHLLPNCHKSSHRDNQSSFGTDWYLLLLSSSLSLLLLLQHCFHQFEIATVGFRFCVRLFVLFVVLVLVVVVNKEIVVEALVSVVKCRGTSLGSWLDDGRNQPTRTILNQYCLKEQQQQQPPHCNRGCLCSSSFSDCCCSCWCCCGCCCCFRHRCRRCRCRRLD